MDTDLLLREWLASRLARVDTELAALRGRLDALIDRVEARFDEVMRRLDALQAAAPAAMPMPSDAIAARSADGDGAAKTDGA